MADSKMTALGQQTSPVLSDILHTVDDPGGTPLNMQIEIGYLLALPHAQIYTTSGAGTQTPGTSYVKLTQWGSNGASYLATADQANNKITLTQTGFYLVLFQVSASSDTGTPEVDFRAYWNSVAQTQCTCRVEAGGIGELVSTSFVGIVDVTTASTDLEIYTQTDNAAASVDIEEAQLVAVRLGPT